MGVALLVFFAFASGATCVFFIYQGRSALLSARARKLAEQAADQQRQSQVLTEARLSHSENMKKHSEAVAAFQAAKTAYDKRVIAYEELFSENRILKTDLRNVALIVSKQEIAQQELAATQRLISERSDDLGRRYLRDTLKWIDGALTPHNYAASKQRLVDSIGRCRDIGVTISPAEEAAMLADLKQEYERVVRADFERQEQARIRAQIREEQQREREAQRQIEESEREKRAIELALAKAQAEAEGRHSLEVERLQLQLAEAIAKSQRAISQAQLTRAGNVYVISNIGAFGDNVFKIGMTRRLEPFDRVYELSGASVPFPFDVHMMIATEDAPKLENTLHRTFHKLRINKTNPRKEFFRVSIQQIVKVVKEHHGDIMYVADPEALQYRQSLNMKEEDQEFVEAVFEKAEALTPGADVED